MRRALLSIAMVALLPLTSRADYVPMSLAELAGTSEAIARGTITKVEKGTVALLVSESLAGPLQAGATITIRLFCDWPCAWRWSKYAVGQEVFLFLTFDKARSEWGIRGAGGEGESPVVDGTVLANFDLPGRSVEYGDSPIGKARLNAVPYQQLRSAIVDFRSTYRLTPARNPWRQAGDHVVHVPFDRIELTTRSTTSPFRPRHPSPEFRQRSYLHRYLAEIVEKERIKIETHKQ